MSSHKFELCDEAECEEIEAFLVEHIYEFNAKATGYFDGKLIAGKLCNESGEVIAAFNGHTWGGCCVIAHLWVHESMRGQGLGRALLQAAEAEASQRGCEQVVLSTHTFQAPAFYERQGYDLVATVLDQPKGHANVTYAKRIAPRGA